MGTFFSKTQSVQVSMHQWNIRCGFSLKNTLKSFDDFKNKRKSVWSNVFYYVKVCIFWKSVQYIIHLVKTQMLQKIPLDKINGTKSVLFFILRAPTHHIFAFHFRFLYKLKHKICPPKNVCTIFHFRFLLVFIRVYTFVQQIYTDGLFDFKTS